MGNNLKSEKYSFKDQFQVVGKKEHEEGLYLLKNNETGQKYIGRELRCMDEEAMYDIEDIVNEKIKNKSPFVTSLLQEKSVHEQSYCSNSHSYFVLFQDPSHILSQQIQNRSKDKIPFHPLQIDLMLIKMSKGLKYLYSINHHHCKVSSSAITWPVNKSENIQLIDQWAINDLKQLKKPKLYRPKDQEEGQQKNQQLLIDLYCLGSVALEMQRTGDYESQKYKNPNIAKDMANVQIKIDVLNASKPKQLLDLFNFNLAEEGKPQIRKVHGFLPSLAQNKLQDYKNEQNLTRKQTTISHIPSSYQFQTNQYPEQLQTQQNIKIATEKYQSRNQDRNYQTYSRSNSIQFNPTFQSNVGNYQPPIIPSPLNHKFQPSLTAITVGKTNNFSYQPNKNYQLPTSSKANFMIKNDVNFNKPSINYTSSFDQTYHSPTNFQINKTKNIYQPNKLSTVQAPFPDFINLKKQTESIYTDPINDLHLFKNEQKQIYTSSDFFSKINKISNTSRSSYEPFNIQNKERESLKMVTIQKKYDFTGSTKYQNFQNKQNDYQIQSIHDNLSINNVKTEDNVLLATQQAKRSEQNVTFSSEKFVASHPTTQIHFQNKSEEKTPVIVTNLIVPSSQGCLTPAKFSKKSENNYFSTIPEVNQRSQSGKSEEDKDEKEYVIEEYENGSRYEGEKKQGRRNGKGKFYYQEGSFYDGEWKNNNMHGYGKLYYSNKKLAYEGQWFIDQFHGRGKVYNDVPTEIMGQFNFNNFDDLEEKWQYYEGNLVSDSKEGNGKLVLSNGQYYEGQFKGDQIHGEGTFTRSNGEIITGKWANNKLIDRNL